MTTQSPINALTFDVEDYYQVSGFERYISRDNWDQYESRVKANTDKILKLLDKHQVKATFFVLGKVAEQDPSIVMDIYNAGHEVASHGYSHKLVYNQSQQEFEDETKRSKDLLESIINKPILGYRAASYSITKKSLWALEIIDRLGFSYDSSIFPIYHDRYGIDDFDRKIKSINYKNYSSKLIEFPITSVKFLNHNIPAAGGGYFRLYPYALTRYFLNLYLAKENQPFIFYLHPWEFDPEQPKIPGLNLFTRFRHYNNIKKCSARLEQLINDFSFSRVDSLLIESGFIEKPL
jgi:polysaccharide deacetylase family protein (PEP-CTERM system associated)